MDETIEMHAVARGRVQGIGFRATVRHHAIQLNLKGTVCNLSDGSVEIYAQGNRKNLDVLLELVKRDIGLSYIDSITTDYYSPKSQHKDFAIIYTARSTKS